MSDLHPNTTVVPGSVRSAALTPERAGIQSAYFCLCCFLWVINHFHGSQCPFILVWPDAVLSFIYNPNHWILVWQQTYSCDWWMAFSDLILLFFCRNVIYSCHILGVCSGGDLCPIFISSCLGYALFLKTKLSILCKYIYQTNTTILVVLW